MLQLNGTIYSRHTTITKASPDNPIDIIPVSEVLYNTETPQPFRYEVNESWKGIYPFLFMLGLLALVIIAVWMLSIWGVPELVGFEKKIIEYAIGVPITIDVIHKINLLFAVLSLLLLIIAAGGLFNYWRYQILGEWIFTPDGLEITGHYTTLGSETIEYEHLKTIVTFRRQKYQLIIPGLGELASLYMYWKYGISEIEIRTELSYLNSNGEHQAAITIDYVENGKEVATRIRALLNASKDKTSGWAGLHPSLFRRK